MFAQSLTGRFLLLTVAFVMVAEVLIFVPSVARFREDYLLNRLERAQIASLAVLATTDDEVAPELQQELLANAGVLNVVLRRDDVRQLVLSSPVPAPVSRTYDLREMGPAQHVAAALRDIVRPSDEVIRVIGVPVQDAGKLIEITMETAPLHEALLRYGLRILMLSAAISVIVAALLFWSVRRFIGVPITRLIGQIKHFQAAPQEPGRIIAPSATIRELREAEGALQSMQSELSASLRQRERLAALGAAVAKVSHDLRNMLTTAQLLADRMEASRDPAVQRTAPKLVASLSRAVNLCETTLAYGRAEEPVPRPVPVNLARLTEDVLENERLQPSAEGVTLVADIPPGLVVFADPEQVFRVLSNIVRNAMQAFSVAQQPGEVRLIARREGGDVVMDVADTGPGLPKKALENLFQPFRGSARKGGSGLGLAIAAELVRGHGGQLTLERTSPEGSVFRIRLPERVVPGRPHEAA
ncbi:MAG: HAMP domain-containing histidine kinase [Rhodobacteraceae bacterium]|nr:HAMP domain-containing histidine kinase [Paracoccaceae bacterium]